MFIPDPHQIQQQLELGIQHLQQGKFPAAVICFQQVLEWQPHNPDAWHLLGVIAAQQQQYATAIEQIERAISIQPTAVIFHTNLGNVYLEQSLFSPAIDCYQRAIALNPNHGEAQKKLDIACEKLLNRGIEDHQAGRLSSAEICYQEVLKYQPDRADGWHLLGVIAAGQREYTTAIGRINRAIELKPKVANFYNSLGTVYQAQGHLTQAIECYQRAIQLAPNLEQAYNNLGLTLEERGDLPGAIDCYQKVLAMSSDRVDDRLIALKHYVQARQQICDWDGLESWETELISAARSAHWKISPFLLLATTDDPAVHFAATRNYCHHTMDNSVAPLWTGQRYNHDKIRLAYLSANFHPHAVAYLMAELFECHDRSRFELFAISFGREDTSPLRQRLERAFDRFIDVRHLSDVEIAQQLRDLEIDIAVDLQGYTKDCRLQILAHRPAPIQVNYLGYSSTLGADFIDYIIADPFVIPPDQTPYFTEKLVYLPDCYLVNDRQRQIADRTPTREACGLPPQGFVFCCFNKSYKIAPTVFDLWMRLLLAVPDSVLWLSVTNKSTITNLRQVAHTRGVNPDRLIFAPREQKLSDHLARHRLADLFLDTLPYNAHTTTSDALWSGLPVLTCSGRSFAARVAGSLLHAIGLPELVTYNLQDYETMALKLATQPDLLHQIAEKLNQNRLTTPLFDCDRFRYHIEAAYTEMCSISQRGEQPYSFSILNA
jgi:protein O-GlcNAc transferase